MANPTRIEYNYERSPVVPDRSQRPQLSFNFGEVYDERKVNFQAKHNPATPEKSYLSRFFNGYYSS